MRAFEIFEIFPLIHMDRPYKALFHLPIFFEFINHLYIFYIHFHFWTVCFLTDTFYVLPCLPNQCKIASFEIGCSFEDVEKIQLFIVQKATCSQKLFLRKPADIKWFIFFNSNEWPAGTDTIFYVRTFSRLVIEIRGVNQSYLSQVQHRGFLVSTSIRFLTNCRVLLLCQIT